MFVEDFGGVDSGGFSFVGRFNANLVIGTLPDVDCSVWAVVHGVALTGFKLVLIC